MFHPQIAAIESLQAQADADRRTAVGYARESRAAFSAVARADLAKRSTGLLYRAAMREREAADLLSLH